MALKAKPEALEEAGGYIISSLVLM